MALRSQFSHTYSCYFVRSIPDIPHHTSALGDLVAYVLIILDHRVWYTQNICWHPAHALLDATPDILQVSLILHSWVSITANAVDFLLRLLLHLGINDHSLDKTDERGSCSVRTGLEERTRNVSRQIIGEAFDILGFDQVDAEAGLRWCFVSHEVSPLLPRTE